MHARTDSTFSCVSVIPQPESDGENDRQEQMVPNQRPSLLEKHSANLSSNYRMLKRNFGASQKQMMTS